MGSVALHDHTELDTKGFQEGLMLAAPASDAARIPEPHWVMGQS